MRVNVGKYQHMTDGELLENFHLDHNNAWLGVLLERYTLLLLGVCMKYLKNEEEAKDSVQQVFLKAITELGKYKVAYFKSWIYMVAKNHCLMKLRNRNIKITGGFTDRMENYAVHEQQEEKSVYLEKERTLEYMDAALGELSEEQKCCVTLFYLEKKSYQDIADSTGFPLVKVKSHIQNGKRNLKISLDKKINRG